MTQRFVPKRHRRAMKRRSATWMGAVVAVVALTGCSGTSTSGATPSGASSSSATASGATASGATASAAVCQAADDLRSSLTALGDVQVVQQGTEAVRPAFTSVQSALAQLRIDAGGEYSDDVDRVQADADQVRTALDAAGQDASAQTLATVASSVGVLLADANALADQVQSTC
jgi:hypothetical protein